MGLLDTIIFITQPIQFLMVGSILIPKTLFEIVMSGSVSTMASVTRFRAKWFEVIWRTAGPIVRAEAEPLIAALLDGHVSGGAVTDKQVHPPISGTVMDIGAGNGNWNDMIMLPGVERVYGVEPNPEFVAVLTKRVRERGMADKYTVVPCGVESLAETDTPKVDCIVTFFTFCSIPEPQAMARILYQYLKPGGRWYVYEHVQCAPKQGGGMRLYQSVVNVIWPTFFDGCSLCRDTAKTLQQAGEWAKVDLAEPVNEQWYMALPHVMGVLTKPGLPDN